MNHTSGSSRASPSAVSHSGIGCRRPSSSRPIRAASTSSVTSALIAVSAAVVSAYGVPTNDSTSSARLVRCSSGANGSRLRESVTSRNPLTIASRSSGSPERSAARRLWISCCSCAPCGSRAGREVGCRRCGCRPRPCFFFGTTPTLRSAFGQLPTRRGVVRSRRPARSCFAEDRHA